ncbi:DUF1292 domain-containing protein [Ligilactobacillus equi]|uniref:UPF0473 protein LEQ_0331c n=2 Tax=Ligilactobacillus equi TaxID=137357 RepID=V7HXH4_9LACO|nr:DUF1292 domain-containing protein [Ligilactobacillus equi]ETA74934.1 hypothetical protein LEQ_0331c [Ligilactobacillus equi DPC 6820]KRL85305.1 hypothetical protein FC36_GL000677 [Ligilactobacillus equi DSM 15833 = JCM 10991]MCQ2556421.1 DUF1292 domain-containing protein [Ligilactobacillus sp.]
MAQANNDNEMITLVDDEGNETLFQVLFTFTSEEYNKSYILLVPAGSEPDEQVDVLAFSFNPEQDGTATEADLFDIEDDEEWAMVENALDQFLEEESK